MGFFSTELKIMSILVVDCYASFQALKCYRFKYKGPAILLKSIKGYVYFKVYSIVSAY